MAANASNPDDQSSNAADNQQNPFAAGLGASLGFFQDWMKAAGSAVPGMQGSAASAGTGMGAMNGLGSWTMPTLDPEELEKRINDLKTVQFWLEQNARMVAMTIQGLEVQRMTLSTLKGMNVSMDALRDSLKAKAPEATSAAKQEAAPDQATDQSASQGINPMQWWDTLTQQFTTLASQAAQAGADVSSAATNTMAQAAASATAAATSAADAVSAAAAQAGTVAKKAAKGGAAHPPKRTPGKSSSDKGQAD